MAEWVVSPANSVPDQSFWPDLFRRKVATNANFWLGKVSLETIATPSVARERGNIVKALARALQVRAAWDPALDLLLAFHPYMTRQGAGSDWRWFVETGLEISRQLSNVTAEAALLDRLGELKRDAGDWPGAAACHEKAQELSGVAGDEAERARALINLGYVYRLQRRYAEAEEVLQEALQSCQSSRNRDGQAFAHTNLGLGHYEQNRWPEALHHHRKAHQIWSAIGNRLGTAQAQHNMGIAHISMEDWPEAESCLKTAIELYEQTNARLLAATASKDLGEAYRRQQRPEEAEELFRQAIGVMEVSGHRRGLALGYNNIGLACTQQRKWAMAEDFYRQSIALWEELGEPVGQANAEDNLADAYLQQQRWAEAMLVLDNALEHIRGVQPTGQVEDLLLDIREHRREASSRLDEGGGI